MAELQTFIITNNKTGTRHPIEAASHAEAIEVGKQMLKAGKDLPPMPVSASGLVQSAATGARDVGTSIISSARDVPEMIGGGAGWAAKQANKILPEGWQSDPDKVSAAVEQSVMTPSDKIVKAMVMAGLITPEFAEKNLLNPTNKQVQSGVTEVANKVLSPQAAKDFQTNTQHPSENLAEDITHNATQFAADALFPGSAATRATRVAVPTAATVGAGEVAHAAGASPEVENAVRMLTAIASGTITNKVERSRQAIQAAKVMHENPAALKQLATALENQGMTIDDLQRELGTLGPEATLMDTGPQTAQLGQQVHSKPGPGRTAIDEKLKTREAGANERIDQGIRENVGPRVSRPDTLEALEQRRSSIGQEYQGAYGQQTAKADVKSILDEIDTEIGNTKDRAIRKQLRDVRDSLFEHDKDGNPTNVLDETDRGLHGARRAIDNKMNDQSGKPRDIGGEEGALLSRFRRRIDEQLKGSSPAIKDIDTRYSQVKKEGEAFETGETFLDRGNHPLSPEEAQKHWDGLSSGEKDHLAKGLTHKLDEITGLSDNDRVAVKRWLGGSDKNSYNFQKLGTVIGPDKAQAVIDMMGREATFQRTYQRTIENSKTAETQDVTSDRSPTRDIAQDAATGALAGASVAHPVAGAAAGVGAGILRRGIDRLIEKLPGQDAKRASLGRMLSTGRHDDLMEALRILGADQNLPPPLLQALLARQQELGNR